MSTDLSIRTTAPYLGMLMLSALLDLFGTHNLFKVAQEIAYRFSFSNA